MIGAILRVSVPANHEEQELLQQLSQLETDDMHIGGADGVTEVGQSDLFLFLLGETEEGLDAFVQRVQDAEFVATWGDPKYFEVNNLFEQSASQNAQA